MLSVFAVSCASTKPVDLTQSRRVVGTENGVRIDAEVFGDELRPSISIPLKYDITNERATPILVADLIPQANYDPDSHTVTVDIGAEIPGAEFLPRLILVQSGQKKSFAASARISIVTNTSSPWVPRPNALRLRVNFLGDTQPFEKLIGIPERAVHDPQLADQLFPKWVELNESVLTNAVPMRWAGAGGDNAGAASEPARRRPPPM